MSFQGLRLLVVDDKSDTRTLLTFLFELEGAEIITAASVGEALEIMSFFKPDIFISDIYLPDNEIYPSPTLPDALGRVFNSAVGVFFYFTNLKSAVYLDVISGKLF